MKQKSNAFIGIFILIFCIIGITMSFIFSNSYEAKALDISQTINYSFNIKGAKDVKTYIPPVIVEEADESIAENDTNINTEDDELPISEGIIEENDEIKALLDEYKDEIDPNDVDRGLPLIEKLDLDYLMSFDRENLTEEQKQEIKNYLQSNLTTDEYNTVLNLLGKYIGLIQ